MLRWRRVTKPEAFMRMSTLIAVLVLSASERALPLAQPAAAPRAQDVAAALQKKYDGVRDFSADFVHEYEGGVLRKKLSERGTVQIKKPGKMRWIYKEPQKKEFVSDGRKMYVYWPADNQVMVTSVSPDDHATSAVQFLAGKGNLTRDFGVSLTSGSPTGTYTLRLDPKLQERDYDWLQVVVDRVSLQLRGLTFEDKQGGRSSFRFSNFKENTGLADKTFDFRIPAGADLITNGSPSY